ncbi:MAG: hypothetical protein R3F60_12545 [bacterium]
MAYSLTDDVLPGLRDALFAEGWTLVALVGAALALVGVARATRGLAPGRAAAVRWGFVALAIGLGLTLAWRRLWLCDDAFISFRYARNLAEGHGLVFNPGEWVEGYTNFLWTAALGTLARLGLDIPLTALALNLASFAAAVALTAGVVRRTAPGPVAVPFAAIALGGSLGFTTFASSGLETMPAAALVMAGVLLARRPFFSGLFFVLGALARPDHLLFWGCMGLALAGEDVLASAGPWLRRLRWKRYLAFTAPVVLVFVPWFLLRWHAYGDVFPNTYYAKSGGSAYYSQGLIYLAVWVFTSGAFLWVPLCLVLAIARPRSPAELRLRLFAVLSLAIYGHYVVRVGGDFMMERFFIVLWPIALAALEVQVRFVAERGVARYIVVPLAAIGLGAAITPVRPIPDFEKVWHLAAEHSFYRVKTLSPLVIDSRYFHIGQQLGRAFADHGPYPRLAAGSVGLLGYYSRLPISDRYGLTSRRVAHKAINERGRPGHEKQAAMEDLQAEGADFALHNLWGSRWKPWTEAWMGGARVYLLRDQPALRAAFLGDHRVRLPARPISAVDRSARSLRRTAALEDWRFLRAFLGTGSDDLAPLVARLGAIADFEEGLPVGLQVEGKPPAWMTNAVPPVGASGEGWLELDGPGRRVLTLPVNLQGPARCAWPWAGAPSPATGSSCGAAAASSARPARRGPPAAAGGAVQRRAAVPGRAAHRGRRDGRGHGAAGRRRARAVGPRPAHAARRPRHHGPPHRRAARRGGRGAAPDDPGIAAWRAEHLVIDWPLDAASFPEGAEVEGTAFGAGPALADLPGQNPVQDRRGGLLNSYHGGDASVGVVRTPTFTIPARGITLRVGGGRDCTQTYVGLEIDGEVVERVCGLNDERLRQRTLPTRGHAGKTGRVVVVDQGTGAWGHVLADDLLAPNASQPVEEKDEIEQDAPEEPAAEEPRDPADPAEPWGPR